MVLCSYCDAIKIARLFITSFESILPSYVIHSKGSWGRRFGIFFNEEERRFFTNNHSIDENGGGDMKAAGRYNKLRSSNEINRSFTTSFIEHN